jgi:anti-sigma regulatory factor (Ser/Thr protein kinase)
VTDTVLIDVPPLERLSKVLRLATTAVASRAGLNLDQADDLNTALDELFRLCLTGDGMKKPFCIRYEVHPDRLEVLAEGINASFGDEASKVNRYRRFIIEKVADRFEQRSNPEGGIDILLVKFLSH